MNESFIAYIDRILAEYNKSGNEALAMALTLFYSEVLRDSNFDGEREYCKNRMLAYKDKDPYLGGFCEIVFKS